MEVWTIISPETFTMMGRKKKLKNYKKKKMGGGTFFFCQPQMRNSLQWKKKKSIELRNDTVSDDIQQ